MNILIKKRKEILKKMEAIDCMQKGSLKAEFRTKEVDGETVKLGPYYKYQVWQNKKNISQRIPEDKVPSLQCGIDGFKQFEKLSNEYVETTIKMTNDQTPVNYLEKKKKKSGKVNLMKRKHSSKLPNKP